MQMNDQIHFNHMMGTVYLDIKVYMQWFLEMFYG